MRRGSIFWGIILLLVGAALLLNNIFPTLFRVSVWDVIWPLVLVLVGFWFLLGPTFFRRKLEIEPVSIPLGGAAEADIRLQHGAGRLDLRSGAAPGTLVSGTCTGGVAAEAIMNGARADVRLRSRADVVGMSFPAFEGSHGYEWNLALAGGLPIRLSLETGASESFLDLRDLKVTDLELKTGASSTQMTLPAQAGETRVRVSAGAASVKITLPEGVAGRVRIQSGLAGIHVDSTRFPFDGSTYQTPGYDSAANRADIFVETGVGSVEIR